MSKATKRKVRRLRHRSKSSRAFDGGFYAPIIGEDMRVMHYFMPLDIGEPLFPSTDRGVYVRTFGDRATVLEDH